MKNFSDFIRNFIRFSSYYEYIVDEVLENLNYNFEETEEEFIKFYYSGNDCMDSEIKNLIEEYCRDGYYKDFYNNLEIEEKEELEGIIIEIEYDRIFKYLDYLKERSKED